MVLVLRVDCDNGYVPYGNKFLSKVRLMLNYLNENYFVPHLKFLGYLEHLHKFIDYLEDMGVRYSIFFKYITLPSKTIVKRTLRRGEIGLHLYSAKTEEEFLKELKVIEKKLSITIEGFYKAWRWTSKA